MQSDGFNVALTDRLYRSPTPHTGATHAMSTTRKLAAILAIGALAAPAAAQAQPPDMHASTATALAQARQKQDLRSPSGSTPQGMPVWPADPQPLRAEEPLTGSAPQGMPAWPASPQPLTPAPTTSVADDGTPVNWPTIALGIAGSLIAIAGLGAMMNRRSRRTQRVRVAA
jgi:hypothetical protein